MEPSKKFLYYRKYFFEVKNSKKLTLKKLLIFQEMELSTLKLKKLLTENKKNFFFHLMRENFSNMIKKEKNF